MQENTKRNILLCAAAKGSFWTRLSFFIMGTGCIRYKQYVRGLIYLLTQIGFFCFLKNNLTLDKPLVCQRICPTACKSDDLRPAVGTGMHFYRKRKRLLCKKCQK